MGKYALTILTASLLLGAGVPKRGALAYGNTASDQLREAFPDGKAEKATLILEIRSQRLLIAAEQFQIEADGKMKLVGCSIVRFPVPQESDRAHPPTAIRCQTAQITLDRPIHDPGDWGNRKVVSVEMSGGVRLVFEE